jgi:hypothetical protein
MQHVVMFSGGVGSWAAAKRVAATHGTANLTLLFTDTKMEDPDLYRFLAESAANVGGELVTLADGRTPWEVFKDVRYLGNTRIDPCSKILKRELSAAWLQEHCDPTDTTCYVGIDWSEEHRFTRLRERWAARGWTYEAPMCEAPYLTKRQVFEWLAAEGLKRPRLYDLGFPHNNCGGFCIKAGQGHFAQLLETMPERYAEHEAQEEALRAHLGKDVAILRDRRKGHEGPLPLRVFRQRLEAAPDAVDRFDIGGCGCFLDAPELEEDAE